MSGDIELIGQHGQHDLPEPPYCHDGENGGIGEMAKPGTLNTLEDAIAWIYSHDGRIDAWWEEQRRFNATTEQNTSHCQMFMQGEIKEIRRDIQAMRKTLYMAMGGCSVLGAIVGVSITALMHLVNP
jgi:hypothetical protein